MNDYSNISMGASIFANTGYCVPEPGQILDWTLMRLFDIGDIRFEENLNSAITKQHIQKITWSIIYDLNKPITPFSADSLMRITSYIDAMPKSLGFSHSDVLKRESMLLIPSPINNNFDVGEFLQPFLILRDNWGCLNCNLIKVGLFLLFFDNFRPIANRMTIRWDLLIDQIMRTPIESLLLDTTNTIMVMI